jgi:hypothetical protein
MCAGHRDDMRGLVLLKGVFSSCDNKSASSLAKQNSPHSDGVATRVQWAEEIRIGVENSRRAALKHSLEERGHDCP